MLHPTLNSYLVLFDTTCIALSFRCLLPILISMGRFLDLVCCELSVGWSIGRGIYRATIGKELRISERVLVWEQELLIRRKTKYKERKKKSTYPHHDGVLHFSSISDPTASSITCFKTQNRLKTHSGQLISMFRQCFYLCCTIKGRGGKARIFLSLLHNKDILESSPFLQPAQS